MRVHQPAGAKNVTWSMVVALSLFHAGAARREALAAVPRNPATFAKSNDASRASSTRRGGGENADDRGLKKEEGWGAKARGMRISSDAPSPPSPSSMVPAGYRLTFDDEFTTLSLSDVDTEPARWYTHTVQCCLYDTSSPKTPTYMNGITDPSGENPFSMAPGGGLDIRLQKTNGAWHSGVIATVNRNGVGFSQQYGYFEMKASFPAGAGTWPAFWLLNSNALSQHADAGEIDIVESYMFAPTYINTTLHSWRPPPSTLGHQLSRVANLSAGFHVFGMLWTAATMTFYCDGTTIYTIATPAMMKQPYYPIVDLGLGGGWPTSQTPQHSDMIVRYVRVYAAQ